MEIIYICCVIVLAICASIALLSFAKKNFAVAKTMRAVDAFVGGYNVILEKTVELVDKAMKGELY